MIGHSIKSINKVFSDMIKILLLILFLQSKCFAIDENFLSLDNWKEHTFPKIKQHSKYKIVENGILEAKTNNSASGLLHKEKFNVYDKKNLEFKWKATNVFTKGDYSKKSGDDYPIRVYIIFEYNADEARFSKRMKYKAAKTLYGEYPPDSSLNYIWSNKDGSKDKIVNSPYTEQTKLIVLQSGKLNLNTWQTEKINIVEDYKRAFGKNPPKIASVAIMADSDNTKESATSYLDWIKIY